MDIKYFINTEIGNIEAINMDNVKRIYIEWNSDDKYLSSLYFDDIKVHGINKKIMEDKFNEIISSEEKVLKIYNSDIIKKVTKNKNRELIFNHGFSEFKDFIMFNDIEFEKVVMSYKAIGIKAYIEHIKIVNVIAYETIDYIISSVLIFMYLNYLQQNKIIRIEDLNLDNILAKGSQHN